MLKRLARYNFCAQGTGSFICSTNVGKRVLITNSPVSLRNNTPFAVHLRKIYNHLRQQLKL